MTLDPEIIRIATKIHSMTVKLRRIGPPVLLASTKTEVLGGNHTKFCEQANCSKRRTKKTPAARPFDAKVCRDHAPAVGDFAIVKRARVERMPIKHYVITDEGFTLKHGHYTLLIR